MNRKIYISLFIAILFSYIRYYFINITYPIYPCNSIQCNWNCAIIIVIFIIGLFILKIPFIKLSILTALFILMREIYKAIILYNYKEYQNINNYLGIKPIYNSIVFFIFIYMFTLYFL